MGAYRSAEGTATVVSPPRPASAVAAPGPAAPLADQLQLGLVVRSWANPTNLIGKEVDPALSRQALDIVGAVCEVGTGAEAGKWLMRTEARRRSVERATREHVSEALTTAPKADPVSRALRYLLEVDAPPLEGFASRDLAVMQMVQTWAEPLVSRPVDDDTLSRLIARRLLTEDFRNQLPAGFVGRERELAEILEFLSESPRPAAHQSDNRVFFVHGQGGVGKSAFMAELCLRILARDPAAQLAVLDFDRADLDPRRSSSLDFEFLKQIANASAFAQQQLQPLLARIRRQTSVGQTPDDSAEVPDLGTGLEAFNVDVKSAAMDDRGLRGLAGRPVVLVLDTFERVEEAGTEALSSIVAWLSTLAGLHGIEDLRIVMCGRNDPLDEDHKQTWQSLQVRPILLGPLSEGDARQLFMLLAEKSTSERTQERLKNQKLVDALVAVSQGIPLIIRLIADLLDRLDDRDFEAILEPEGALTAEIVQGILYDRTLRHIPSPRARLYAHPGLVLPQLDVELIRKVLAPIVEPNVRVTIKDAQAIFQGLQEPRWLTRIAADGRSLRQRSDLRALLLKLMASDPSRAADVNRVRSAARAYHGARRGTKHQAFHIYYDLLDVRTRDDLAVFEGISLKPYLPTLRSHIADLPSVAQDFIKAEQGRHLALAEAARSLPDRAWSRYLNGVGGVRGEGERIVERADPMLVLPVWRGRPTGDHGRPPTFVLQALADTGEWRSGEVDIPAVVAELVAAFGERPPVWRHLLKRLYWLTRYALLADPGRLGADHAALLQDVLNRSSPSQPISALPGLVAVADAFDGGGSPILTDAHRWLGPSKTTSIPRIRLVLAAAGDAEAVRNFQVPTSRDIVVFQTDWRDRTEALGPALKASLEPIADGLRDLGPRPSIATLEAWLRASCKEPVDVAAVEPKSWAANFLLLGPTAEFHRPVRQALREAFPTAGAIRDLLSAIRSDFTIWPSDFEGDRFVELLERDPVAWFLSLARFADQSRVLDRLLVEAARLAPQSKLPMVAQHYSRWNAALTGGIGSYWWSNRVGSAPLPSLVTLQSRETT